MFEAINPQLDEPGHRHRSRDMPGYRETNLMSFSDDRCSCLVVEMVVDLDNAGTLVEQEGDCTLGPGRTVNDDAAHWMDWRIAVEDVTRKEHTWTQASPLLNRVTQKSEVRDVAAGISYGGYPIRQKQL